MGSANSEHLDDYNRDVKQNNNDGLLEPGPAKLLAQLISKRELRLLAETEKLGTDTVISSDWHDMPGVAREYQSVVSGDPVKVDEVEGFDVMASEHGDGPVISFEEKPSPQADCETGDSDNLPR